MSETEVIDQDEAAAKRIAAVFVAWNESGQSWREFVDGLRQDADAATAAYQTAVTCVPLGGQLPLIHGAVADAVDEPKKPRKPRRVMMHECNLADLFECQKCHETEPIPEGTNEAARNRGIPCPKCNGPEKDPAGEK